MNTQVGKSIGIALLLAAGLLAALFAMGVFAPAGAGADVRGGTAKPEYTLSSHIPGTENVTLTVVFQVDQAVTSGGNARKVTVTLPEYLKESSGPPKFKSADDVSVKQGGKDVGFVEAKTTSGEIVITITEPKEDRDALMDDTPTTLVIKNLDIDKGAKADKSLTVVQGTLQKGNKGVGTEIPIVFSSSVTAASVSLDDRDAGATGVEMTLTFTADTNSPAETDFSKNPGSNVVITIPESDYMLLAPVTNGTPIDLSDGITVVVDGDATRNKVEYVKAKDAKEDENIPAVAAATKITVNGFGAGDEVEVTIAGLTNPGKSQTVTVMFRQGIQKAISRTDSVITKAPVEPSVELSSLNAGADVKVTVMARAGSKIRGGNDIFITMPGFGIPDAGIDEDEVLILGPGDDSYYGNPSDISVSGSKITVTIPTKVVGDAGKATDTYIYAGDYSITFKQNAGLSNPTSRGEKTITVADGDADNHSLKVMIVPHLSLTPGWVSRGDMVTFTGKGLTSGGTATLHLRSGKDANGKYLLDAEQPVLGSGMVEDNSVTIEIDTNSDKFMAGSTYESGDTSVSGENEIFIVDSSGNSGLTDRISATLGLLPTVTLDVSDVKRSGVMGVTVSDWYFGDYITNITVGGQSVVLPDGNDEGTEDDKWSQRAVTAGTANFKVIVPRHARLGEQQVTLSGSSKDKEGKLTNTDKITKTVNVGSFDLKLTPGTAVTDQVIRIEGSGFGERTCITSIMVGDESIDEATTREEIASDRDDCVKTDSNGELSNSFKVPDKLKVGDYLVVVRDANNRVGQAMLTVPKPEIELDPTSSQRGSTVTVVGKYFPAEDLITVTYGGDTVTVSTTDTVGKWRATFDIPVDATIGREHEVVAQSEKKADGQEGRANLSAKGKHQVPDETLTVSPEAVASGGQLAIRASNLPLHTPVTLSIGGLAVAGKVLGEDNASDGLGNYVDSVLVPQLTPGTHTVELKVHTVGTDVDVVAFVEILPIVTRPTDEVFLDLITAQQLTVVWRYNNATSTWASYDPAAPDELNDLMLVSTDEIVWVEVTETVEFQGGQLYAGWNLITLE